MKLCFVSVLLITLSFVVSSFRLPHSFSSVHASRIRREPTNGYSGHGTRRGFTTLSSSTQSLAELAERISSLNLLELNVLTKTLQKLMGVSDDMMFGGGGGGGSAVVLEAAPEPVKEKELFDVKIISWDENQGKIKVLREVKEQTGLGLKEAKDLIENCPCTIKSGVKKSEGESIMQALKAVGCVLELS